MPLFRLPFTKPAFRVWPDHIEGNVGDAVKLSVNRPATFVHSDATVATVDSSGQVRLVGGGGAYVAVFHADGRVDVSVVVKGAVAPTVTLTASAAIPDHEARITELERRLKNHEGPMHGSQ